MIQNNNIFYNNYQNRNYEDNSKSIDLGRQWNLSKEEDIFNDDPLNPKWNMDKDDDDNIEYSQKDIELLNERIKNYCEKNKGRKNYLEFCDNNSEIIQSIKDLNPSFD